uniref:Uncharacterized protein n=1 Tax=Octopus bimaculoides TaxID=37653 RepID=A0A0L8FJN7_OCTBM
MKNLQNISKPRLISQCLIKNKCNKLRVNKNQYFFVRRGAVILKMWALQLRPASKIYCSKAR